MPDAAPRRRNVTSAEAEAAFRARIAELGGVVLEPVWLGSLTPHRVRCRAGHACAPTPNRVQRGQGLCRVCIRRDPATAEAAFRARVAELGGVVLEAAWRGAGVPHAVVCRAGHRCSPRPTSVQKGRGICRTCAGRDPATAEARFRARLVELGAELLEPRWLGSSVRHRVRCRAGHACHPRPYSLARGRGPCRACGYAARRGPRGAAGSPARGNAAPARDAA